MSWLSKQFKSLKKHVIPKEIRKPFTELGQAVPNEITGAWDDAIKGSAQIADAIGFGSVAKLAGYDSVLDATGYGPKKTIAAGGAAPGSSARGDATMAIDATRNKRRRRGVMANLYNIPGVSKSNIGRQTLG